jgi:futalosine hydrolase
VPVPSTVTVTVREPSRDTAVLVVAATDRELAFVRGADTLCCGIGPVEAALQTARRLMELRPDAVLHIGIAGARNIEPPALVLGSESVYCDAIDPSSALPRLERLEPDAALLARVRDVLPEAQLLPIATSGRVGGGTACEVEAMEGFGVLRACALAGVPAVELRAISNAPGQADRGTWRFEDAFAALGDAVARVLASGL